MKISLQRGEMQNRLIWLGEMESHIKAALEYEIAQAENDQSVLFAVDAGEIERSPVATFIREVLSDYRPRSLDDLKNQAAARRLDFKGKNPGRVLHFALVGMAQSGLVERLAGGDWRLKQQQAITQENLGIVEDTPLM